MLPWAATWKSTFRSMTYASQVATAFVEADIHVVCDEPLAVSVEEAEAPGARCAPDPRAVSPLEGIHVREARK